jgi:hypothetical protein
MQPSFQVHCNNENADGLSCGGSGYSRNRGCRDDELSDGGPVENIGRRLGRDSGFGREFEGKSLAKIMVRCTPISFEATASSSIVLKDLRSLSFRGSLDAHWVDGEAQSQKCVVVVGVYAKSAAIFHAFTRPADEESTRHGECSCWRGWRRV